MENKNTADIPEVDIDIVHWWRCVTSVEQKGDMLEINYDKGRLEDENSDLKTIDPSIHKPTEEDEFQRVKLKLKDQEFVFRVICNEEELEKLAELFKAGKLDDKGCSHTIFLTDVGGIAFGNFTKDNRGIEKIIIPSQIDFSYCYFNATDFDDSIFNKKANFSYCYFNTAYFSDSTFNAKADFNSSYFNGTANFNSSYFNGTANFVSSTFNTPDFMYFIFNMDFIHSLFNTPNFSYCTFKTTADFNSLRKCKFIEFENATINFLDIKSLSTPLKVSLKGAQIEKIDFTNTVIESSTNRETFTVLKNIALKQNDQISALDFYQKEMFTYFKKITWRGNFTKKFILLIERYISKYGTSWVRAGISILVFNFLIAFINHFVSSDPPKVDIVIQTINNMNIFDRVVFEAKPNTDKIIQFVRLAGNAFLYYELIKSFRMFSRKL